VELLLVGGRPVVEAGHLRTADERDLARRTVRAHERLLR
jgi:hypothetical protein